MLSRPDFMVQQIICVFTSQGEKLSFKNDNLVILDSDKNIKLQVTCHQVFSLVVVGHFSITSGLLMRAKRFNFSIALLSYSLKPYGYWHCAAEGNFLLRDKQYTNANNFAIAKVLIANKMSNQLALLSTIRNKTSNNHNAIKAIKKYIDSAIDCDNPDSLLGFEGSASRAFFQNWFEDMPFNGRKPRAKDSIINCLLDIGYTYLFNFIESLLRLFGFDVYKGVYHQLFYQRKSLVCDIVEPFRCIIDNQIRKSYNLGQINVKDFTKRHHQYFLWGQNAKPYTKFILTALLEHKEEVFIYVRDYYRSFIRNRDAKDFPKFNIR